MEIQTILLLYLFIFGTFIGSFLNVLIYRLPRKENTIFPRSSCPTCKTQLRWFHNIPIFSFLFLKGRCAFCTERISIRYPLIEFSIGLIALLLAPDNIFSSENIWIFTFKFTVFCAFFSHFLIDLEHKILPDSINLYLAVIFLISVLLVRPWTFWLIGGALGFGATYLVTWLFYVLKGQVGLGGGDIKLFGALGIYLGPLGIMQNIFGSCLLGSVVGVLLIFTGKMKRSDTIPFGPYIILVAGIQIFFPALFNILMSLFFSF